MVTHSGLKMILAILMMLAVDVLSTSPLSANPTGYVSYQFIPGPSYTQSDTRALLRISGDASGVPLTQVEWRDPLGAKASCRPLLGGCIIRNGYSAVGTLISSTHEFDIGGQGRLSGTYTAIASYCTSQYGMACVGMWKELFRTSFSINDVPAGENRVYLPHLIR